MHSSNHRFCVAAFALITCLMIFACGAPMASPASGEMPVPVETISIQPFNTPAAITRPVPTEFSIPPAIPETRRLTLEYPTRMRAGVEGQIIRLTLEVDDLGNITPTAGFEGNIVIGDLIEFPNLYETHNVTAEARLDLAGLVVQPSDSIYEPLKPGQSVTFYWSIRPDEAGIYRGTVWLHLNFVERDGGEESRIALSAQFIEIEAVDFFGLSVNVARTSGVIGSIIGGVMGFPFLEEILRLLFGRKRK